MNVVVITSNHLRHLAYARMLCESTNVSKVFIEEKPAGISSGLLQLKERQYFPQACEWLPHNYTKCKKGEINNSRLEEEIRQEKPDIIFVFGSSLLKENIFSIPTIGCINIHTGLVQYYRGVDSAFWALHDSRPDRIGSTVHFIDKSIDAGEIIYQGRPSNLCETDKIEDVFLKNCMCGFELVVNNLDDLLTKEIKTKKLTSRGKLYQIKDKTPEKITEVSGKIGEVLSNLQSIDVLMSAYNAEDTIEKAVQSVLDQTYRNFNLYVFDDCSTDSTLQVLKKFDDPRLIVLHSDTNMGTYASKNYMLKKHCKSEYVALHDADDTSEPQRLERQMAHLQRYPEVACVGTSVNEIVVDSVSHTISEDDFVGDARENTYPSRLVKEDIHGLVNLAKDEVYDRYLKFKFCKNGSVLINRRALEYLGGWDGRTKIAADTDLFIRILSISTIHNLATPLYNRYFHKKSLTASKEFGIGSNFRKQYNLGRSDVIRQTLQGDPVIRDMWYPKANICVV